MERYRALVEEHLPHATFGLTSGPGDEANLAERAIEDGYDVVVAVGGDGTWAGWSPRPPRPTPRTGWPRATS